MQGATFVIVDAKAADSAFGYDKIHVVDRYLFKTVGEPSEDLHTLVSYHYMWNAVTAIDGKLSWVRISEDKFYEEYKDGVYRMAGEGEGMVKE